MHPIITVLTEESTAIFIAGLILALAWVAYLAWFRPAYRNTLAGVQALVAAVRQDPASAWPGVQERARDGLKKYPHLASSWLETTERVFDVSANGQGKWVMFASPKDLWNASALMSRRFNLALAESVPNILVGMGLLFTFIFLSAALIEATSVLGPDASSDQTRESISKLLSAAGGKFTTSLAGLFASLVWTFQSKRALSRLSQACDQFMVALTAAVPANGGELVVIKQIETAGDGVALSEELLNEAREQTGTFKRFETDLAVTLAGAINKAFTPQMEAMTAKLVTAIDGLSEKLGTMNQEALKKMLEDFASMLKKATDSEMAQLQATLKELAEKLTAVGGAIGQGGAEAGEALDKAGALLVARVHEVAENLAASATTMENVAAALQRAMNDLESTVVEATSAGRRGALFVTEALDKTGGAVDRLGVLTVGLGEAATAIESASGKMADVVDSVEELSKEQRTVVTAVREVAPSALAAVERVTGVLDEAAKQTLSVMQQTKLSMESTASTLGKTVASITEGVEQYTLQVADLHRKMDGQLARAVGSFDKGVSELAESVEELGEIMPKAVGGFDKSLKNLGGAVSQLDIVIQKARKA